MRAYAHLRPNSGNILSVMIKNSIRNARTPQPEEIVFNTMRYRSSETVHRIRYFQSSVSVQITSERKKLHVKTKY